MGSPDVSGFSVKSFSLVMMCTGTRPLDGSSGVASEPDEESPELDAGVLVGVGVGVPVSLLQAVTRTASSITASTIARSLFIYVLLKKYIVNA